MSLRIVLALTALCSASRVLAQVPDTTTPVPEELTLLRHQFESQGLSKARLLSEQFANALTNIIREAGAEGDYEQAIAAQHRRAEIVALYSTPTDDAAQANVFLLKPGDARTNGAVNFDRSLNALVSWKTAGSVATWDIYRVTPGSYEVTLTYAAAEMGDPRPNLSATPPDLSTGGDFEFYEDSSLPGADQNRRAGTVASTGGWTEWRTLTLPAIQITRPSARLALRITKAKGTGGVMNLKGIRLAPPAPDAPAAAGSPDSTSPAKDELTTLQQLHVENLRHAMGPLVSGYMEKMTGRAAKTASSDPDASSEYTAEGQRAAQLLDDPFATVFGGKGPRPGGGAEGFRELHDATYVQNLKNTGDCFRVKQGGEEFFVRLLWVYCAPTDEKEEKHLKECAEYFGITREDALVVGREAQEFTSGYLSGKTLTLLTRGAKDDQGNLLVAVRPGKYGDFAGVLVDNGIVMIKQASAKKGPAREHEEAVLRNLAEREAAAKTRKVPAGAWARTIAQ